MFGYFSAHPALHCLTVPLVGMQPLTLPCSLKRTNWLMLELASIDVPNQKWFEIGGGFRLKGRCGGRFSLNPWHCQCTSGARNCGGRNHQPFLGGRRIPWLLGFHGNQTRSDSQLTIQPAGTSQTPLAGCIGALAHFCCQVGGIPFLNPKHLAPEMIGFFGPTKIFRSRSGPVFGPS